MKSNNLNWFPNVVVSLTEKILYCFSLESFLKSCFFFICKGRKPVSNHNADDCEVSVGPNISPKTTVYLKKQSFSCNQSTIRLAICATFSQQSALPFIFWHRPIPNTLPAKTEASRCDQEIKREKAKGKKAKK